MENNCKCAIIIANMKFAISYNLRAHVKLSNSNCTFAIIIGKFKFGSSYL